MFYEYEITIYLPTLKTLIWWMVIGFAVSARNLYVGIKRGFSLHKWYYMIPLFVAIAAIWPWCAWELYRDKVT